MRGFFLRLHSLIIGGTVKKMPTIEIAGLCLPLKPQKERRYYSLINIDKLEMNIQLVLDERI